MSYKIVYTEDLPEGVGGRCVYPFMGCFGLGTCIIKIRPKYKEDVGILNHEIVHYKQYKKEWFHVLKFNVDKQYSYECELEAYKEQLKYNNYTTFEECGWIAYNLMNRYGFDLEYENVKKDVITLLEDVINETKS